MQPAILPNQTTDSTTSALDPATVASGLLWVIPGIPTFRLHELAESGALVLASVIADRTIAPTIAPSGPLTANADSKLVDVDYATAPVLSFGWSGQTTLHAEHALCLYTAGQWFRHVLPRFFRRLRTNLPILASHATYQGQRFLLECDEALMALAPEATIFTGSNPHRLDFRPGVELWPLPGPRFITQGLLPRWLTKDLNAGSKPKRFVRTITMP